MKQHCSYIFLLELYRTLSVYSIDFLLNSSHLLQSMLQNSGIVSRLIEDMIPVPPDTLSLEQIREPQASRDLRFMHKLISVLRLANDELADLHQYD